MTISSKTYFQNIDALRFIAFVLVFTSHVLFSNATALQPLVLNINKWLAPYSYIGICFFFTLSAFLITWILLTEIKNHQKIKLHHFYIRRSLRIWPLYFLIIFIAYLVLPTLNITSSELPNIIWLLSFTFNYYLQLSDAHFLFFLAFLWTIAIEEQFYFVWGLVMRFFHKSLPLATLLLFFIYLIFIALRENNIVHSMYYNTLNYLPNFALGAFLAHTCFYKTSPFSLLEKMPRVFWGCVYLSLLILLLFFQKVQVTVLEHAARQVVFAFFFCLVLFDQCFNDHALFKLGKQKQLNYLGKISYGLYCWHGIAITAVKKLSQTINPNETRWDAMLIYPLLSFVITVLLAVISYTLFERKFLKLKDYFSTAIQPT